MKIERQALIETMRMVILQIRIMGWDGENTGMSQETSKIIADLADSIHNIPEIIEKEEFDLNFHTKIMLGGFDVKHQNYHFKPYEFYKSKVNELTNRL